ncbi:MAG TPA: hypothetical protein VMV45_09965 [Casimicrobiaceae bacterium]|nr:hypothetical protein [Casimicrobiaceae bacterium]
MNGLTLLGLLVAIIAIVYAYRAGVIRGRRERPVAGTSSMDAPTDRREKNVEADNASPDRIDTRETLPKRDAAAIGADGNARADVVPAVTPSTEEGSEPASIAREKARIIRSYEQAMHALNMDLATANAAATSLREIDAERARCYRDLAEARGETARYRQIVIDIENNAPPPLLDVPGAPDDLKLIVGVGPVLERMLHQLGVTTYRQIASWTERDIDDVDARLPEFPGRIRRDEWVTQARELHLSKYGQPPARM